MVFSNLNCPRARPVARGFSMIEVLVTLMIISLALLGTAGLQAYAMRLTQGGQFRTQAVFLVADLVERMEANKSGAVVGAYVVANITGIDFLAASNAPSTACATAPCIDTALATYDLSQWQHALAAALPQSSWSVVQTVAGDPSTYTITASWVDRRTDTTMAAGDANSQFGSNAAGTGEKFSYTATRTLSNN
ncbi:MAG: type IV pilus modification protein PilV [Rhodoferax sp.]|uniref:type IV pilus modification protein PilV n=1 Tax=Rhodoferax sp. TaxID=50421 RepID=UPI0026C31D44|nr:type IV pilus modification protein PilV [Rhodoferax sp.]MDO8457846.1 type IV pilus modification protein PilV [Burkholderiaceae bacterium]MDP2677213.1 type IV pilus modification protein PilV [Rhodoferax sp.]